MAKECINVIVTDRDGDMLQVHSFVGELDGGTLNKAAEKCFIDLCSEFNMKVDDEDIDSVLDDGYVKNNYGTTIRIWHSDKTTEIG